MHPNGDKFSHTGTRTYTGPDTPNVFITLCMVLALPLSFPSSKKEEKEEERERRIRKWIYGKNESIGKKIGVAIISVAVAVAQSSLILVLVLVLVDVLHYDHTSFCCRCCC